MESTLRRMPIGLLDHLQTICARQDQQFIADVGRILGLGASATTELRRKILGTLGKSTIVFTESNPWWVDTQCPIMILSQCGMWTRCGAAASENGKCKKHHATKKPLYSDPMFVEMKTRTPFRHDGEIYWVGDDGSVLDSTGSIQMDFKVNLKSRTIIYTNPSEHHASAAIVGDDETKTEAE